MRRIATRIAVLALVFGLGSPLAAEAAKKPKKTKVDELIEMLRSMFPGIDPSMLLPGVDPGSLSDKDAKRLIKDRNGNITGTGDEGRHVAGTGGDDQAAAGSAGDAGDLTPGD